MKKVMVIGACVAAVGSVFADDVTIDGYGNYQVAPGGTITVGATAASTNNLRDKVVSFANGGTVKAIQDQEGGYNLWCDYVINGNVTFDASDLSVDRVTEWRRSIIATNGTITVMNGKNELRIGSQDPGRTKNFPLYDIPNISFSSGSGTIRLMGEATLRDWPGSQSAGVTFAPSSNKPRLAIAGSEIVARYTDPTTGEVDFNAYGSQIVLLDEAYVPPYATVVLRSDQTFLIRPSDVVYSAELQNSGSNAEHVYWSPKEGSGSVPFSIALNGGTLGLVTTRSSYEFTGKIHGGGTVAMDMQGQYTNTFSEVEGSFVFANSASSAGTVVFKKVNPGSRLCDGGVVAFQFEEGALPANYTTASSGGRLYVFVPSDDGTIDLSGLSAEFCCTSAYVPYGSDVTLTSDELESAPKIGVANGATVNMEIDDRSEPTVVGGNGTIHVTASDEGGALRVEGRAGTVVIDGAGDVALKGTFAGDLVVNGNVSLNENLPWTEADVPSAGLVDWYDASDTNSLKRLSDGRVEFQYPRGKKYGEPLSSGKYLWGTGNRMPYAVTSARGLGRERTWIDYNHPSGYAATSDDGNVLRFMPYDKSSASDASPLEFRTLLIALDSCNGGGTVMSSAVDGNPGEGKDFTRRNSVSCLEPIWPASCSDNVKTGVTRLNGVDVNRADGLTGGPEVLSLTAAGNVTALCVDTYHNTQSKDGVVVSQGTIQGEMLMYDGALDSGTLANLEAYLMGKWTGVLPDGWSDLREATIVSGTGTVTSVAGKLPSFGDSFTGVVNVEDTQLSFEYDGAERSVAGAIVARGATVSLKSPVTINVTCKNMQEAAEANIPIIDASAFSGDVSWRLNVSGADNRVVHLRRSNGQLLICVSKPRLVILIK